MQTYRYRVTWHCGFVTSTNADTPEEAARKCWDSMRAKELLTSTFKVRDEENGQETDVSLEEIF